MVITYNFHFSRGVKNRKKRNDHCPPIYDTFAVWVSIEIFRNGVIQAHNTGNWYFKVFIGAAKGVLVMILFAVTVSLIENQILPYIAKATSM